MLYTIVLKPFSTILLLAEHPSVNGDDLLYQINGSLVILGWSFEGYDSSYTSLIIIQCHKTGNCTHHNVTYNPNGMLVVQKSDGLDFHLVVYQDGLEAYRSQFAEKNPTGMHACQFVLYVHNMVILQQPFNYHFYPTALKGCQGIVFTHGGWAGGRREKVCSGCISETVRCRKLILGRDIG